jgi:hypothetical protein
MRHLRLIASVLFVMGAVACSDGSSGGGSDGTTGTTGGQDSQDGLEGVIGGADATEAGADSDSTDGSDGSDATNASDDATEATDGTGDGEDGTVDVTDGTDGTVDATDTEVDGATDGTPGCPGGCAAGEECINGVCAAPEICVPNQSYCQGIASTKKCNEFGTAFLEPTPCPEEQYCGKQGKCGSKCALDPKLGGYVGCTFWSADLPNYADPTMNPTPENTPHAVVVSNPGELDAEVDIIPPPGFTISIADPVVKGKSSAVFVLPIMNVQHSGISARGIQVQSTRPVLVHQFNPWDNKASNDASLLLPENALGTDYVVLSWPTSPLDIITIPGFPTPENQNGYFTVIAPFDDTEVSFQVSCPVRATPQIPKLAAGALHTVVLNAGEVLNIEGDTENLFQPADLSGSRVFANKPISVFAGHEEAVIAPEKQAANPGDEAPTSCCADHLEEQLLPTNLLGTQYVAVKSKPRGKEPDFWRIQAADVSVEITTDPPLASSKGQPVVDYLLSQKGSWVEIQTDQSFVVTATGPIQVMQYFVSRDCTDDFTGDPSQIGAAPVERFRTFYAMLAPPLVGAFGASSTNYATVAKETDAPILVDGNAIPEGDYAMVGSGGWRRAYVALDPGVHTFESTAPFGLTTYAYGNAVSYGAIGGLDISTVEEQ